MVLIHSHAIAMQNTLAPTVKKPKYVHYATKTAQNIVINKIVNVCVVNLSRVSFVSSSKIHASRIHAKTAVDATAIRLISIVYVEKASKAKNVNLTRPFATKVYA